MTLAVILPEGTFSKVEFKLARYFSALHNSQRLDISYESPVFLAYKEVHKKKAFPF